MYHRDGRDLIQQLNALYRSEPALFDQDDTGATFEWLELHDADNSTLSFLRRAADGTALVCVLNATPCPRENYRLGVPHGGFWREVLNTDSAQFGGANIGNYGGAHATEQPWMSRSHSVVITLPPLAVVVLKAG